MLERWSTALCSDELLLLVSAFARHIWVWTCQFDPLSRSWL